MQPYRKRILTVIGSSLFLCLSLSCQPPVEMLEIENNSHAEKKAPAECVVAFREFFAYLTKSKQDIVTDTQAQTRWLSKGLRRDFEAHIQRSGKPGENPGYPSNQTFIGVWDRPSTWSIVGTRHYDYRNGHNPASNRAVIDVLYEWDGHGSIDNNYPNSKQLRSFVFVDEDGRWKLDDIFDFDEEYSKPGSLRGYIGKD